MMFERCLESVYVTTLAHIFVIIVCELKVTLNVSIEINVSVLQSSEPLLSNKHSRVWAIISLVLRGAAIDI
jgi:hypothetical protein